MVLGLVSTGNAIAYPQNSLYNVPLTFHDDKNQSVSLDSFKDKTVILAMIYTSCRSVCTLMVQKLKKIMEGVHDASKNAEVVIVSLDPANDTPAVLAKFREREQLPKGTWHLLTGKESDVRTLANLIGYSYQKNADTGDILHSNKITLLEKEGVIVTTLEGLNEPEAPFINAIE